jgi:hypothetical protein
VADSLQRFAALTFSRFHSHPIAGHNRAASLQNQALFKKPRAMWIKKNQVMSVLAGSPGTRAVPQTHSKCGQ